MEHRPSKTALTTRPDILDVSASEDERLTLEAGHVVRAFFGRLAAYFATATDIEQRAVLTLARARKLTVPTTEQADVKMQAFVKDTTAQIRAAEVHHQEIKSALHGLHARVCAVEKRAISPLQEANRVGNAHHNTYTAAEQRRVREEQARRQWEAEKQEQRDREADLARQEAAAVQAEQDSPLLSARESTFVDAAVRGIGDGPRWATLAGYAQPRSAAERLQRTQKIQDAIHALKTAAAIREQAAATRQQPLAVQVETVRPHISKAAGAHDRTTWSAEVYDERALIDAIIAGTPLVSRAVLRVHGPAMNDLAVSLHGLLDSVPGVRAKSSTKVL